MDSGQWWWGTTVQGSLDTPPASVVEVGGRLNPSWVVYGDAWVMPTTTTVGADIGARFKGNLELYANGWSDIATKEYAASVGLQFHF